MQRGQGTIDSGDQRPPLRGSARRHDRGRGVGSLRIDTANGGDTFAVVEAADVGLPLHRDVAQDLVEIGIRITRAATEQIGFTHPDLPDWNHIWFCQFADPVTGDRGGQMGRNTVAIDPGKLDRSPTGTGCSARIALLRAQGVLAAGDSFAGIWILGKRFDCRIERDCSVAGRPAILPSISRRSWIIDTRQLLFDPGDPFPRGCRLGDKWPVGHRA